MAKKITAYATAKTIFGLIPFIPHTVLSHIIIDPRTLSFLTKSAECFTALPFLSRRFSWILSIFSQFFDVFILIFPPIYDKMMSNHVDKIGGFFVFIFIFKSTIHNLSAPPVGYADSPLKEGADNASLPEGGGT